MYLSEILLLLQIIMERHGDMPFSIEAIADDGTTVIANDMIDAQIYEFEGMLDCVFRVRTLSNQSEEAEKVGNLKR